MLLRSVCVALSLVVAGASYATDFVPVPAQVQWADAGSSQSFVLHSDTRVDVVSPLARFAGQQMRAYLTELDLPVVDTALRIESRIQFLEDISITNPEGYSLTVAPKAVTIRASDVSGFIYGAQTLLQMLPLQATEDGLVELPGVEIADEPQYKWRGLMIDCVRHWWPMDELKKILDLMVSLKLNTFHWHLTDDQGWRIEIAKYPKLTEVAGWRDGVGFKLPTTSTLHYRESDGKYGGFYSQAEARELVRYAHERGITVVPEIEIPGHASAMLHCYPDLGCTTEPIAIRTDVGGTSGIMCAGNDNTIAFCKDVLSELVRIFPSQYIHVGGDEARKSLWKQCEKCQARIRAIGATDENQLQNWMVKQMETHLSGLGRKLIGWDEIIDGGNLTTSAAVMVWRGSANAETTATQAGHEIVMVPEPFVYIDHLQSLETSEPRGRWRLVSLEKVYEFEPRSTTIPLELHHLVWGGQANLWTEYIANEEHLEYMIAPRICALAEVLWSPKSLRKWADFRRRMDEQVKRLDARGFNYRRLDPQ